MTTFITFGRVLDVLLFDVVRRILCSRYSNLNPLEFGNIFLNGVVGAE